MGSFLHSFGVGIIERRFGDLKNHFGILGDSFTYGSEYFQQAFRHCLALHNLISDPEAYPTTEVPLSFTTLEDDNEEALPVMEEPAHPASASLFHPLLKLMCFSAGSHHSRLSAHADHVAAVMAAREVEASQEELDQLHENLRSTEAARADEAAAERREAARAAREELERKQEEAVQKRREKKRKRAEKAAAAAAALQQVSRPAKKKKHKHNQALPQFCLTPRSERFTTRPPRSHSEN
jgi:hypothetical protein